MHVGARYYDAQVGRFITRDTFLDQKPYLYCEHDPINRLDPSGHFGFGTIAGGAVGGFLLAGLVFVSTGPILIPIVLGGIIGGAIGGAIGGNFDPPALRSPGWINAGVGGIIGGIVSIIFLPGGGLPPVVPPPNGNPVNWNWWKLFPRIGTTST